MTATTPKSSRAGYNSGFTIVELMVIVSIISILVVIAIPAYQDYAIRSKVTEGLTFAAEARTSISERYYTMNVFPTDNSTAGLVPPDDYGAYDFINRLEVGTVPREGTITITFKLPNTVSNNKQLLLIPSTRTEVVTWTCRPADAPDGIKSNHAPPNCRF